MQKKSVLYWIPAILMMCLIFSFSAAKGESSSGLSGRVSREAMAVVNSVLELQWSEEKIIKQAQQIEYYVRKAAHVTEFAILSLLISFALHRGHGLCGVRLLVWMELLTVFYAGTDEFHQWFVPGRCAMIRDVIIDGCGGLLGTAVIWGMIRLHRSSVK